MVPCLTMAYNVVGLFGCYVIAIWVKDVDRGQFMENLTRFVSLNHYYHGLVKAVVFGFVLSVIACFQGYNAGGGAKGSGWRPPSRSCWGAWRSSSSTTCSPTS